MARLHEVIAREVSRVKSLELGSSHYEDLIARGVDRSELDSFIRDGCSLKRPGGDVPAGPDVERLLDMGGVVAGGGALAVVFQTHRTSDFDVFFSDPVAYVKAMLSVRDNRRIDVCFCVGRAYDSFDLAVSKCSVSREGVDVHDDCVLAVETGVSDICPHAVIHPDATLRRMLKYHARMGMRFRTEQVLALCSVFKVEGTLARRVLTTCVDP